MAVKLMCIPNENTQITPSVDYNYWFKRLNTQLNESTIQKFKSPKLSSMLILVILIDFNNFIIVAKKSVLLF